MWLAGVRLPARCTATALRRDIASAGLSARISTLKAFTNMWGNKRVGGSVRGLQTCGRFAEWGRPNSLFTAQLAFKNKAPAPCRSVRVLARSPVSHAFSRHLGVVTIPVDSVPDHCVAARATGSGYPCESVIVFRGLKPAKSYLRLCMNPFTRKRNLVSYGESGSLKRGMVLPPMPAERRKSTCMAHARACEPSLRWYC
jgi:hypothetical protein